MALLQVLHCASRPNPRPSTTASVPREQVACALVVGLPLIASTRRSSRLTYVQILRPFAMTPAQALATPKQTYEARAAVFSSILPEGPPDQDVVIFIPSTPTGRPCPRVALFLAPMAGSCKMPQCPTLPPFPTTTRAPQMPMLWVVKARVWCGEPPSPSMTRSTPSRTF